MSSEIDVKAVQRALAPVVDPEIGISIMELNLVDKVEITPEGKIHIEFHQTTPFCPPFFAMKIAQDIKESVAKLPGVKAVTINATGHYMSEYINRTVNAAPATPTPASS